MLSFLVVSVFISSNRVIAATLATLQSEGDAVYDLSQSKTSLVTVEGAKLRPSV